MTSSASVVSSILAEARQRAQAGSLPYSGAVTPQQAYALIESDPRVKLVDVRTKAERDWVGRVAIPPAQHAATEWNVYPGGTPNPHFLDELAQQVAKSDILLFLCRSGVRSQAAARTAFQNGYAECFDILEGFEGDKDADGHRKLVSGWCKAGLPWVGA